MKRSMLLIVFFLVSINVVVAQDLEPSNRLYQLCAGCHGVNAEGNENLNAPALSIFSTWYLERQIRNFNQGLRENHPGGDLLYISDENIHPLADYIAGKTAVSPQSSIEGNLDRGEFVFQHCISCHGEFGEGDEDVRTPRLSGQYDWYLLAELIKFKQGLRGDHPNDLYGAQMMEAAMMFDEDMLRDAVAYISSLEIKSDD